MRHREKKVYFSEQRARNEHCLKITLFSSEWCPSLKVAINIGVRGVAFVVKKTHLGALEVRRIRNLGTAR